MAASEVCEVCGEPAVCEAYDLRETEDHVAEDGRHFANHRRVGPPLPRCEAHRRVRRVYDRDGVEVA